MKETKIKLNPQDLIDISFEQLGTKEKKWVTSVHDKSKRYLLKFSKASTGEHWSEYIAYKLCRVLNIPCATYEIINYAGRWAVISENLIEDGYEMVMGNEFLYKCFPTVYPEPVNFCSRINQHTISQVKQGLENVQIKESWGFPSNFTSFDIFCGYLLLDALISNQDRHHENWAVLYYHETQTYFLCETYDHAASLGRELTPERRKTLLTSKDQGQRLPKFVSRARSEIFNNDTDKKPLLTLDAFCLTLNMLDEEIQRYWINKINYLKEDSIREILDEIDNEAMDQDTKNFVYEMIIENRNRIKNVIK